MLKKTLLILVAVAMVPTFAVASKDDRDKESKDKGSKREDRSEEFVFTDDFTGSSIRLPDQACTGELAGQPCVLRTSRGRLEQDDIDFDTTTRTSIRFDLYTAEVHVNCGTDSTGFIPFESTGVYLSDKGAIMGTTAVIHGDKVSRDVQLKDPFNASVAVSCQYSNRPPEIYGEIVFSGVGKFACLSGTQILAGDGGAFDPNTDLVSSVEAVVVTTDVLSLTGLKVPASCP